MVAESIGGVQGMEVARAYLQRGRRTNAGTDGEIHEGPDSIPTAGPVHRSGSAAAGAPDAVVPGPPVSAAARDAERLCREHRLRQWVKRVNDESGLTPNTIQVWERWTAQGNPACGLEALPGAMSPLCRRALQWVRRWRRRWGVRRAKAKAVSRLSMADLRRKAASSDRPGVSRKSLRRRRPGKNSGRIPAAKKRPP